MIAIPSKGRSNQMKTLKMLSDNGIPVDIVHIFVIASEFELYKEARNKAKLAKRNAILAYLEAKNIKKTYMIENMNDSDSDFDAEIEEASESELDNL